MRRSLVSLGLAVVLVTSFLAFAPAAMAAEFPDLGTAVLNGYGLSEIEVRGMSQGYPDGLWRPSNPLPRQQFVKMAVDNFGIPLANPATPTFTDVAPGSLYYPYIEGAVAAGLIQGVGNNMFAPLREITRQEAAAILVRWIAKANGFDTDAMAAEDITEAIGPFGDDQTVGPSLVDEVAIAVELGLLQGSGGNLFPTRTLIRIEGAALLARSSFVLASVYRAGLAELNDSGVTGTALLYLRDAELRVLILARGLETGQSHLQHIHGFANGTNATCPPESADTNMDGIISLAEDAAFAGPALLPLEPYPTATGADGMIFYQHRFTGAALDPLALDTVDLTNRAINLHGMTVAGAYDATVPVACGEIVALSLAYHADLREENNSGATGQAFLWWRDDILKTVIIADGLEAAKQHPQHIHGFAAGTKATCPPASADANMDGIITLAEGAVYTGPALLALEPFPTAYGTLGKVFYAETFMGDALDDLELDEVPLTHRVVNLHGLTVGGTYEATLPIACGEIAPIWMRTGMVFTQTNDPDENEVLAYSRALDGSLTFLEAVETGGMGHADVGHPQGAVVLSDDYRWLFAVNGGSNDVSVFSVDPGGLTLVDREPSGGTLPISVTSHGNWIYVLNAGGSGNISGFTVGSDGSLTAIAGSTQPLSAASGTNAAQIEFGPMGDLLVVTERDTNMIDVYPVNDAGVAGAPVSHESDSPVPYGFAFTRMGYLIVSEAAESVVSSYSVSAAALTVISGSVDNVQGAPCWVVVTPNDRYAYVGNGMGPVTTYTVASNGAITLLDSDAGPTPTGSSLDLAISGTGRFLYALAVGMQADAIGAFRIMADGSLVPLMEVLNLPATATGLAAL